jgi:transaldolase
MGASFRNIGEIKELAGCDLLTISPQLLGMSWSKQGDAAAQARPRSGQEQMAIERSPSTKRLSRAMHAADRMATDKLKEGIEGFSAALVKLEHRSSSQKSPTESFHVERKTIFNIQYSFNLNIK